MRSRAPSIMIHAIDNQHHLRYTKYDKLVYDSLRIGAAITQGNGEKDELIWAANGQER